MIARLFHRREQRSPGHHETPRPDVAAGRVIVPRSLVTATFVAFVPYWRAQVETAVFWAGPDGEDHAVATTLVQPALLQTRGNYRVPADARAHMARALGEQGLVIHAQVHTHPETWVGHSPYDDAHAYSTAEGSLSIVWPQYGRSHAHDLAGTGLHLRRQGRWVELRSPQERAVHLQVVDDHLDLRFVVRPGGLHADE